LGGPWRWCRRDVKCKLLSLFAINGARFSFFLLLLGFGGMEYASRFKRRNWKIFDKFWPIEMIDRQRTQHLSNFWKRKTRKKPWMALKGYEWDIRIGPLLHNWKNGKSAKHGCKKSVSPSETYKQLEPDWPQRGDLNDNCGPWNPIETRGHARNIFVL
jgi:hypothetical protein